MYLKFNSYNIKCDTVTEAWKAIGYLSFELPNENNISINELSSIVMNLQNQLKDIENR